MMRVRVACRQNMMSNIESGGAGSIKTDGLDPHEIARAMNARGLDIKYLQASWIEKVRNRERVESIKAEAAEAAADAEVVGGGSAMASLPRQPRVLLVVAL